MYVPCLCLAWTDRPNMCVRPSISRTGPDGTGMLYTYVTIHLSVSSDWTRPDCHLQLSFASNCSAWPGQCLLLLTGTMSSPVPLPSPVTSAPPRRAIGPWPMSLASHRSQLSLERASCRHLLLINDEIAPTGASSNEPQGADQPADKLSVRVAAGGCRVRVGVCGTARPGAVWRPRVGSTRSGYLSDGSGPSKASNKNPAASVPLGSRKRAVPRSESDVGSNGSRKRACSESDVGSRKRASNLEVGGGCVGLDGSDFSAVEAGSCTASSEDTSSTQFESSTELLADAEAFSIGKSV